MMIYYFDRYRDGNLMAQGAKVTLAKDIVEAEEIAKNLFKGENCTFVLREKKKVKNE